MSALKALAKVPHLPPKWQPKVRLGKRLMLADLPGYGYARAPKVEIEQWTGLIEDYLRGRAGLRRVCLLIDARHGLKESDRRVMALLDQAAVDYDRSEDVVDDFTAYLKDWAKRRDEKPER